jgi:hypothetical protein
MGASSQVRGQEEIKKSYYRPSIWKLKNMSMIQNLGFTLRRGYSGKN